MTMNDRYSYPAVLLAGCGKSLWARQNLTGLHVWAKPGLSGYLVCLVHLVSLVHLVYLVGLVQPNKQDKPNKPNKRDRPDRPNRPHGHARLVDFFSILLVGNIHGRHIDSKGCLMRKGRAQRTD